MKTYCVYKHTNMSNGKAYVGMCDENRINQRWAGGHGYYKQKQFGNDIKKYGWGNFEHAILFAGLSKQEAIEKESECIALFRTCDPNYGYNISVRGDKPFIGQHHTEETKKRISAKVKQYEFTEEHKKHISEKKSGINHHFAKPVYQFSKNGEFIKEWSYMGDAAKTLSIMKCNISLCCLGKRPTAGGYVWSYERG